MVNIMSETLKRFGCLSNAEKLKLFEAWIDGATIEALKPDTGTWCPIQNPRWFDDITYRIEKRKPYIDWNVINPIFKYLAIDADGSIWIFSEVPYIDGGCWFGANCRYAKLYPELLVSFSKGNCDWRDSLICREES